MSWHDGLDANSQTYVIAASTADRIRIVAGPGTGKSFALKRRVARLLEEGAEARRVLPVTFTRVAAEDLHRELINLGVEGAENLHGRTLHALGLWILRRQRVLESTGRTPRPLNQFEIEPLLHDLPESFGHKRDRRKRIRAYEAAWARLQQEEPGYVQSDPDAEFEHALRAWLIFHNSMLIGEVIPELYRYLRDNPAARERRLFAHILVDEFQDLNKVEQRVIDLMGEIATLCIIGDDDQSIYSFKFAHPEGIRNWHQIYPDAEDHFLLECKRCPTSVVRASNSLIARNRDREARQLQEVRANGAGVFRTLQYDHLDQEVEAVSQLIQRLIIEESVSPGDILVLAQRQVIGSSIFERLRELEIPVKSYYQESELGNLEAQERLSILKLLVDRNDRVAFRWLIGYGANDFRKNAYRRLRNHSVNSGLSPCEVAAGLAVGEIVIAYTQPIVNRYREIDAEIRRLEQFDDLPTFIANWLPANLMGVDGLRELTSNCSESCETKEEFLQKITGLSHWHP